MKGPAFWLLVPFAAALLFGLLAPRLMGAMTPRAATLLLGTGSLMHSGGTVAAAGLVVLFLAGETPVAAELGHWSIHHLETSQPFDTAVAVFGVAILAVQAVVLLRSGTRHGRGRAWWTSHRTSTGLVAIDDPDPTASHRQGRGVLRPPRRHGRPRREGPAGGADLHQPPCRDRRDAALARFTLYTLFGCLPWTFALAAAGDALASKWDSVTSYFTVASVVAIIAVATRWLLKVRGHRTRQIAAEPDRSPT